MAKGTVLYSASSVRHCGSCLQLERGSATIQRLREFGRSGSKAVEAVGMGGAPAEGGLGQFLSLWELHADLEEQKGEDGYTSEMPLTVRKEVVTTAWLFHLLLTKMRNEFVLTQQDIVSILIIKILYLVHQSQPPSFAVSAYLAQNEYFSRPPTH